MKNYNKKNLKVKKNNQILKKIIFLCFVFLTHVIWGQEKINHIRYSIELKKSGDNNESHYNSLILNLESKLKQVTFDLNYNSSISKFSMSNNLLSEEDNSVILDIADMLGKDYYNKVNCDTIYSKNEKIKSLRGFTCFSINRVQWQVTDEKKIINGYECTKAFGTLEKNYGDGEKVKIYDVVAWFCPEFKSSFGPKSFTGLQGLILELEQPLVVFKVLNVDYITISNDLSIPTENIISESSLYESINQK